MNLSIFPPLNAFLNATTALLLIIGYLFIRRGKLSGHKVCMLLATLTSAVFLACYLYYHAHHGITKFQGAGLVRRVYFFILTTHTILAALQLPLIITTLYRAFQGDFDKHKIIARLTLPIWLYVSVTGVVVYWMLYQVNY